jgi:hypothetical protein
VARLSAVANISCALRSPRATRKRKLHSLHQGSKCVRAPSRRLADCWTLDTSAVGRLCHPGRRTRAPASKTCQAAQSGVRKSFGPSEVRGTVWRSGWFSASYPYLYFREQPLHFRRSSRSCACLTVHQGIVDSITGSAWLLRTIVTPASASRPEYRLAMITVVQSSQDIIW